MIRLAIPFTRIVRGYDISQDNITDGRKYLHLSVEKINQWMQMREYRVRFGISFQPTK